ncbi:MAG: hypothetical protein J6C18_05240 [Bacteroidaceae bacterium]|nr:hypothetical protein [Bacteroidaceae bacterium]
MKTNHTIRIKFSESGEEHTIVLLPGRCIQVSVGGDGKLRIDHSSGDAYARQTRQMKLKDDELKKQKDENVRLESTIDALLREKERRKSFDECLVKVATTEYFRMLMEEQSQKTVQARTELETRCFAFQCRVSRIKKDLKDYISSKGPKWNEGYWVIVHKIFCDLRWWTGKDTDFVEWVGKSGYKLTENNFKKVKGKTKGWLERWYAVSGSDRYVVTARELYDLFAGGPNLPKATIYEDGYIARGNLTERICKAQMGIQGLKYTDIRSALRGYYRVDMVQRINPMILADSLTIPLQRHKIIGTSGLIDVTKPGRRRRRQTTKALREREERKQLIVPRLQGQLLAPTHCI